MQRGPCTIISPAQSLWVKLEGEVYLCEGTQKLASVFYHLIPSSLLLTLYIFRLEKDLYNIVKEELEELQEKGSYLRIMCKWDFYDLEDKWWW